MSTLSVIVLTAALAAPPVVQAQQESALGKTAQGEAQMRAAIQRAIPFIEAKGASWIESRKCVSRHRVGQMVWTLDAARQQGFAVSKKLDEWRAWALTRSLEKNDKGKIIGMLNREGVAQLLFADSRTEASKRRPYIGAPPGPR